MSCGCNCGSILKRSSAPISVQAVIPAANIVAGWDAADLSASPVALWPDASGNGVDLAQAIGANQPAWGAATGPNGQPTVLFDGVDDRMANLVLDLAPPGTTPTFYWGVLRQVTWTVSEALFGENGVIVSQQTLTPSLRQFNGTGGVNDNAGLTVNVFKRLEAGFSNAVADYIKAGSVRVGGASAGNTDPVSGFFLGTSGSAGILFSNIEVCELWIFNVFPTTLQLAELDVYVNNRYGLGLT